MKGITLTTYRSYRPGATKAQLRAISDEEVRRIYREGYWNKVRGDDLPLGLDMVTFDGAVNSGPSQGARWLQEALGVDADGKVGPLTISAAQSMHRQTIIERAMDIRMAFLQRLSTWPTFGRGWSRRVASVRAAAMDMAAQSGQPAQPAPSVPVPSTNPLVALLAWLVALFRRH